MANKVLLKKSSVTSKVPLTTDLDYGELALNYTDGKIYFKNASNVIKSFTIDDSVVTLAGTQTLTNKTLTSPTINGAALSGTLSGNVTLSGITTFSGGDVNNSAIKSAGYNQRGGAGYHGFLEATNTFGTATNPNKFFRLNSTGALEVVNSAYTTTILSLTDAGVLTVPQINAGGSTGTNGQVLASTGTGLQWLSVGGTGTVTSIIAGTGLTGGTITSSGTVAIDTTVVATLTGTQTLTNKTLTLPTIGGTGAVFNGSTSGTTTLLATAAAGTTTLTLPAATDTLVGKATTDTLTNKTIAAGSNTITGLTNTNLSGAAGITNANLANSTISGVALGGTLATLTLGASGTGLSGSTTYNGSGAATFTVTSNATNLNTASTVVARDASGNFSAGTITATLSGTATQVSNTLTIGTGLSGTSYNGSGAVTIALANTAVTAGSYGSSTSVPVITVDAQGRITAASTSAISGSLTFTGDVTGSGNTGASTALTLAASGVTAGTYTKITVDAKGRATSGTTLTSADLPTYTGSLTSSQITTGLGFTPYNSTNPSGYITSSGSISGSAGSVSGLTLTSSANGINPDSVTQNQIGYNTSVSLFGQTDGGLYSSAYSSSWIHQIYGDFRTGQIAIRGKNSGTWQAWRTVLDSSNVSSYALSTGGGSTVTSTTYFRSSDNSSTSYGSAAIQLRESQGGGSGSYLAPRLAFHWGGVVASQIGIRSDGGIQILNNPGSSLENLWANNMYASGFQQNSDIRIKDNVVDSKYGLKEVMKLRSVEYDRKDDGKHHVGLIAQEVEKIIPEFVDTTDAPVSVENSEDITDFKTVNYAQMVSVLVKAVQELKAEVDELRSKLGE